MSETPLTVVVIDQKKKEMISVPPGSSIADLLEKIGHNPEVVVVKLNGVIVPEEENLKDGDKLEIIPIVSGG